MDYLESPQDRLQVILIVIILPYISRMEVGGHDNAFRSDVHVTSFDFACDCVSVSPYFQVISETLMAITEVIKENCLFSFVVIPPFRDGFVAEGVTEFIPH